MKINENYKVLGSHLNFELWERKIVTKDIHGKPVEPKERWKCIEFHANLGQVLKSLVKRELQGTGMTNFRTVVEKVEQLEKDIEKFQIEFKAVYESVVEFKDDLE